MTFGEHPVMIVSGQVSILIAYESRSRHRTQVHQGAKKCARFASLLHRPKYSKRVHIFLTDSTQRFAGAGPMPRQWGHEWTLIYGLDLVSSVSVQQTFLTQTINMFKLVSTCVFIQINNNYVGALFHYVLIDALYTNAYLSTRCWLIDFPEIFCINFKKLFNTCKMKI